MNRRSQIALLLVAAGAASIAWGIVDFDSPPAAAMVLAAIAFPLAVGFATWGRIEGSLPTIAVIGGIIVGIPLTVALSGIFYVVILIGVVSFSDTVADLLDWLSLDSSLTGTLETSSVLLLIAAMVLVAPLTEEFSKTVGGLMAKPRSRQEALAAGVAAGVGFAMVENLVYAAGGVLAGGPWPVILLARSTGAAVHPLATGIVMLGWWEWRENRDAWALLRHFLGGVGVHALWNGAIAVLIIAEFEFELETIGSTLPATSLAYSAALGAIVGGGLWMLTAAIAEERAVAGFIDLTEARTLVVWIVLTASIMAPVAVLVLALPGSF